MKKLSSLSVFYILLGVFLVGCQKDDVSALPEEPSQAVISYEGPFTVVDGHLHFTSQESLNSVLDVISECLRHDDDPDTKSVAEAPVFMVDGFTSVAQRREGFVGLTKAGEDRAGSEMTVDEFAVYKAEELLTEPALSHVMDTSLVIGVGDYYYKVTEKGSFEVRSSVPLDDAMVVINEFDPATVSGLSKGDSVRISDDIVFYNTYGNKDEEDGDLIEVVNEGLVADYDIETKGLPSGPYNLVNGLHNGYNVITYKWQNSTIFGKIMEFFLIKDRSEYHYIDDNHRVRFKLFNNNFGFIRTSGLHVCLQVRRRFLFISTWPIVIQDTSCSTVLGLNYLYSEHSNYMSSTRFGAFESSNFRDYKVYTPYVTGLGSTPFLYGKASSVPYFVGFSNDITMALPVLKLSYGAITAETKDMLSKLYEASPKELLAIMKSVAYYRGRPKEPTILIIPSASTNSTIFKNDITMAAGRYENYHCSDQQMRFLTQGGFSWSGGIPAPIQFSTYNILAIDAFGAVKYEDKWYGVRFVFEK